jgi:hypothetical protein
MTPTRIYTVEDAIFFLKEQNIDIEAIAPQIHGKLLWSDVLFVE